jgi:hypothetical protein
MRSSKIIYAIALWLYAAPAVAQQSMEFRQLPKEVRDHATRVRRSCNESYPDMRFKDMQGIQILDLEGDGSRDIFIDNKDLCGDQIPGANCSNRGCDMIVYKETSRGKWREIFKEHLYSKYVVIDWDTMRVQLMVVSIYAGDPRCLPNPKKDYTSGRSCNLIVTYRNNQWNWQVIR